MPHILAIDTATEVCSVALGNNTSSCSRTSEVANSHAKVVLELVQQLLNEQSVELKNLDALALTIGPGSFTGIRIGSSVAQGLSFGTGLPIVPITTLELLGEQAMALRLVQSEQSVCVALDARMGELYWQLFKNVAGVLRATSEPMIGSPEQLNTVIAAEVSDIVGIGHGWGVNGVDTTLVSNVDTELKPAAEFMLPMAIDRLEKGESVSAFTLQPLYLRNEITWQKRKRIRQ